MLFSHNFLYFALLWSFVSQFVCILVHFTSLNSGVFAKSLFLFFVLAHHASSCSLVWVLVGPSLLAADLFLRSLTRFGSVRFPANFLHYLIMVPISTRGSSSLRGAAVQDEDAASSIQRPERRGNVWELVFSLSSTPRFTKGNPPPRNWAPATCC